MSLSIVLSLAPGVEARVKHHPYRDRKLARLVANAFSSMNLRMPNHSRLNIALIFQVSANETFGTMHMGYIPANDPSSTVYFPPIPFDAGTFRVVDR